ncbi:hypothetical protein MTBLM1_40138 [Rhodospirillaceae bacterium LM-1]|nr:hypothetical protein MTBLM1_40138 [Rhodospirillaceae bacterium LM-1]
MSDPDQSKLQDWLDTLPDSVSAFARSLAKPDCPGRFYPVKEGLREAGRRAALGFSCFALKLYWTLGLWQTLEEAHRLAWIYFIQSYQLIGGKPASPLSVNAFVDEPVLTHAGRTTPVWKTLLPGLGALSACERLLIAESKQAMATLMQVGAYPLRLYEGCPHTPKSVHYFLSRLDWKQPWTAGAQLSNLSTILTIQRREFADICDIDRLLHGCVQLAGTMLDSESGAYFSRQRPEQHQMINGTMKVLTALDWLDAPIHEPRRLVDTCLAVRPQGSGCDLVDHVYVLYRCHTQDPYRSEEIAAFCDTVLHRIYLHAKSDGGFSFYQNKSITGYYGLPISEGRPVGDLHATALLTWALAMIFSLTGRRSANWKVIRP